MNGQLNSLRAKISGIAVSWGPSAMEVIASQAGARLEPRRRLGMHDCSRMHGTYMHDCMSMHGTYRRDWMRMHGTCVRDGPIRQTGQLHRAMTESITTPRHGLAPVIQSISMLTHTSASDT